MTRIGGRVPFGRRTASLAVTPIVATADVGAIGWTELTAPPSPFEDAIRVIAIPTDGDDAALIGPAGGSDLDTWLYDFDADSYTSDDPLPSAGYFGGVLIGTKSLVVGGTSPPAEAAWWTAGTWSVGTNGSHNPSDTFPAAAGGLMYCLFASDGEFSSYDPATDTWTDLSYPSTTFSDITPLVADGAGGLLLFKRTETFRYDIGGDTWDAGSVLAPRITQALCSAAGVIDGKVYLAGGRLSGGTRTDALDIYDIAGDSWSSGPVMSTASRELNGVVHDGALYVFGVNGSPFDAFARKYVP